MKLNALHLNFLYVCAKLLYAAFHFKQRIVAAVYGILKGFLRFSSSFQIAFTL